MSLQILPVKFAVAILILFALAGSSLGQAASQEWQAKAIRNYPELGVPGSPLNKRFLDAYNERRKTRPHFFDDPKWPLALANEVAVGKFSAVPSGPAQVASPSTNPKVFLLPSWATLPALLGNPVFWLAAVLVVLAIALKLYSDYDDAQELKRAVRRREELLQKHGDCELVDSILAGRYWHGQSAEQLLDALGYPSEKDHKRLKTIDREVWKYRRTGRNRFALRITLDDGRVATWDEK